MTITFAITARVIIAIQELTSQLSKDMVVEDTDALQTPYNRLMALAETLPVGPQPRLKGMNLVNRFAILSNTLTDLIGGLDAENLGRREANEELATLRGELTRLANDLLPFAEPTVAEAEEEARAAAQAAKIAAREAAKVAAESDGKRKNKKFKALGDADTTEALAEVKKQQEEKEAEERAAAAVKDEKQERAGIERLKPPVGPMIEEQTDQIIKVFQRFQSAKSRLPTKMKGKGQFPFMAANLPIFVVTDPNIEDTALGRVNFGVQRVGSRWDASYIWENQIVLGFPKEQASANNFKKTLDLAIRTLTHQNGRPYFDVLDGNKLLTKIPSELSYVWLMDKTQFVKLETGSGRFSIEQCSFAFEPNAKQKALQDFEAIRKELQDKLPKEGKQRQITDTEIHQEIQRRQREGNQKVHENLKGKRSTFETIFQKEAGELLEQIEKHQGEIDEINEQLRGLRSDLAVHKSALKNTKDRLVNKSVQQRAQEKFQLEVIVKNLTKLIDDTNKKIEEYVERAAKIREQKKELEAKVERKRDKIRQKVISGVV